MSNAYGISSVPTLFGIGRDGAIEQVCAGWRKPEMDALGAVGPAIAYPNGKPVEVPQLGSRREQLEAVNGLTRS